MRQAYAAFAAAVVQSRHVPALPPTHPLETYVCLSHTRFFVPTPKEKEHSHCHNTTTTTTR